MRRISVFWALSALIFSLVLLGCTQEVDFVRVLPLEGQHNFRDIGGYETADGKTVKTGVLFRSGELHGLTDADVGILEDLGIKTAVSFLTPKEIEARGMLFGGRWASLFVSKNLPKCTARQPQ